MSATTAPQVQAQYLFVPRRTLLSLSSWVLVLGLSVSLQGYHGEVGGARGAGALRGTYTLTFFPSGLSSGCGSENVLTRNPCPASVGPCPCQQAGSAPWRGAAGSRGVASPRDRMARVQRSCQAGMEGSITGEGAGTGSCLQRCPRPPTGWAAGRATVFGKVHSEVPARESLSHPVSHHSASFALLPICQLPPTRLEHAIFFQKIVSLLAFWS